MAARPGEENVATLFGDVHYFYSSPTADPLHHRFDKGSYVYLFEDASNRRARIEVANKPGTDDQDAFDGYLDKTQLCYSYKHHCMVTLTVGDVSSPDEWHLPTYDPRNENKYHYPLHSIDIYFWTQQDALQFVNGIRRVLPPAQVEVSDEPGPPPHRSSDVSSVVQKLENAAISPPPQQSRSSQDTHGTPSNANGGTAATSIPTFAPPPLSAVSTDSQSFAPILAYNPAAPPAPETVQHREKTPPPEDGGLNPLHATLAYDSQTPFSPGLPVTPGLMSPGMPPPAHAYNPPPGAPSFPGPPRPTVASPGMAPAGFGQHGAPGLQRASTMPAHMQSLASPGLASPYGANFPGSPSFAPGTPGFPPGTPGLPPPQQQQQQQQQHHNTTPPIASPGLPPPPPGGYSQYQYGQQQPIQGGGGQEYSIHQQMYRPTEGETTANHKPKVETRGRLEENAGRLERGMTGMFKKFEKRFG